MSRNLRDCVKDGEPIKHTIKYKHTISQTTWIAIYDRSNNMLECGTRNYIGESPLNQFATQHYMQHRPDRNPGCNAWRECKIYRNNEWIPMSNLQSIN